MHDTVHLSGRLRAEYLTLPVGSHSLRCSIKLCQISHEFDILVLLSRRQLCSQVSGHLPSIDKLLIAGRVRITSQEEELAFIRENVLHPEASRIGMRRGLVDDRDVGTGDSAI